MTTDTTLYQVLLLYDVRERYAPNTGSIRDTAEVLLFL